MLPVRNSSFRPTAPLSPAWTKDRRWGKRVRRRSRRGKLSAFGIVVILAAVGYVALVRETSPPALHPTSALTVQSAGETWSIERGDVGASGATTATPVLNREVAWRVALGSPAVVGITADDRAIYVGVEDAQLVALSFQDGRELWRIPVPGRLDSPPTVADGRLYLGLRDGRVMALDASDGSPLWTRAMGGPVWHAPVVVDGVVWVISRPTFLALDAEDGRVLREYAFRSAGNTVGAVVTGSTVAFSTSDKVLLFDRENLQQDYFYRLRGVTHLVASHDTIVATSSRILLSFDTNSRRPWWDGVRRWWGLFNIWGMAPEPPLPPRNWLVDSPGEHFSPVLTDTHVILALRERAAVYAYSLSKGVLDWVWEVPDTAIVAPPMLTPGGVVVLEEHSLVLLDRLSGRERARHEFDDALRRVLITDHGTYLATDTAEVLAMR